MIIFLDNLRGFSNQFIELNQVNFLVGENSTGKSSLLSIISLLSDSKFILTGEFRNSYVNFGLFDEIINKKSTNTTTFSIGIIKTTNSSLFNERLQYDALLLVFNEKDGFPNIHSAYCRVKDSIFKVQFSENKVSYSLKQINEYSLDIDKQLFSSWKQGKGFEDDLIDKGSHSVNIRPDTISFMISSLFQIPFMFVGENGEKKRETLYKNFFEGARRHLFFPGNERGILENITWIAPIRSEPKPLYSPTDKQYSPEGDHIPTILRDIFEIKNSTNSKKIIDLLTSFGKASGLYDNISIEKLRKKQKNSPFEININLHGNKMKISNVGYGISQALPILAEVARSERQAIFSIQQPEVHLHPKSQAFFGEFIFTQANLESKNFIVETHSDYLIDRFRLKVGLGKFHKKTNILFFDSGKKGNSVTKIEIDKDGNYTENQPAKFRDFFLKEQLSLLGF